MLLNAPDSMSIVIITPLRAPTSSFRSSCQQLTHKALRGENEAPVKVAQGQTLTIKCQNKIRNKQPTRLHRLSS